MTDDMKIYPHMICPLCGNIVCPDEDLTYGCSQCDLNNDDCEPGCTCDPSRFVTALRNACTNIGELEEMRYKLMLIEKIVYANNHPVIPVGKIKHILKGGWKYARKRFL